jgi:hypothetical protein
MYVYAWIAIITPDWTVGHFTVNFGGGGKKIQIV